jgi:hypothetical protein
MSRREWHSRGREKAWWTPDSGKLIHLSSYLQDKSINPDLHTLKCAIAVMTTGVLPVLGADEQTTLSMNTSIRVMAWAKSFELTSPGFFS